MAWLCDIDGTLALKGDRSPYDWAKVGLDAPRPGSPPRKHPGAKIAAHLGLTKDQAIGLFRRLMHRVPVYYALRDDETYADYYR